jgi:serine/threonine-protein kinase ATR
VALPVRSSNRKQLSICLWTPPGDWPAEVQELRALLCSETGRPFENKELNDQSLDVVSVFRSINKLDEQPPSKRRRTAPETANNAPSDVLNHLVMLLNSSPADPEVPDLKDFHVSLQ